MHPAIRKGLSAGALFLRASSALRHDAGFPLSSKGSTLGSSHSISTRHVSITLPNGFTLTPYDHPAYLCTLKTCPSHQTGVWLIELDLVLHLVILPHLSALSHSSCFPSGKRYSHAASQLLLFCCINSSSSSCVRAARHQPDERRECFRPR